ncbi:MAG: hypothetical protein R6V13_11525 [Anaerolineae bacterium]
MREFEKFLVSLLLLCGGAVLCFPFSATAQGGSNRAGLIVAFDKGDIFTECVAFEGELTGYELLERAGLSVVVKDYGGGLGFAVCKIEDLGCDYPAENCFCRADDISWRYWYWEDGGWVYSGLGASNRAVEDGDMDVWIWGKGQRQPPDMSFPTLCAPLSEALTVTPTFHENHSEEDVKEIPSRTPRPPLLQDQNAKESPEGVSDLASEPAGTPDRVAMRIATSVAQNRATPVPAAEKEEQRRDYGVFALLITVLMVIIGYVVLLRKQSARTQGT